MISSQANRDLFSTFINQLWRLISGPIILILIPIYLSEVHQGYWFLFGSLAALSVFADLGFSNIILQFSAHEFAFLQFNDIGLLVGDDIHLKKIGSFLRFTLRWIGTICLIVFPLIYFIGIWYLIRDKVLSVYIIPWTIFSIGSLLNFFNSSILSFIEGMNKIEAIQNIRFRVAIINTIIIALVLFLGGNIYALALSSLISSSSIFLSLFGKFRKLLKQTLNVSKNYTYNWTKEILPLFSKYAVSFASGYFIFQIYTPLTQYFHGPIQGGKVGITLALVMAIFSMSNIWIYTITPQMNIFVSKRNKEHLDKIFRKRLMLSIISYLIITLMLALFIQTFKNYWIMQKILSRFLPVKSFIILIVCYILQLVINSWAIYLRAHKQEPYVIPSIISAIWIALLTFISGKYLPQEYFFLGFLSSYIWGLPVCYIIYIKSQRKWYGNS